MKTLLIVLVASSLCNSETVAVEPSKWVSPSGGYSIDLTYGQSRPGEPLFTGTIGGHTATIIESPLIDSPISREFGGITWFPESAPKWVGNRYLVFELADRIAVIDAAQRLMILNTSFEAVTKAPAGDRWSAIRYRPIARNQEILPNDFKDTLFVIDLPQVIKASASLNDAPTPFQHLQSLKLPGSALAKPVWMRQGDADRLAIAIWADGRAEALLLNPKSVEILERKPLGITVSNEVAHSPWINRDAEPEIIRATIGVLSDTPGSIVEPRAKSDLPSSVGYPKTNASEAKPTAASDEPTSSTPWSVVAVLIVATIGLLWLLVKNRR